MVSNNLQTFIKKQYALSLAQAKPNGFAVSAVSGNSFTVTGVSEPALPLLQILAVSISYSATIMVTSVAVATSNGTMQNLLLQNTLNEAIATGQSVKGIGTPFETSFGAANMSVNGAADATSNVMNNPTDNLVKTYNIALTAVPLGADGKGVLSYVVTYSLITEAAECYGWSTIHGHPRAVCGNKYFKPNGMVANTCFTCFGPNPNPYQ